MRRFVGVAAFRGEGEWVTVAAEVRPGGLALSTVLD
jgi:hypothetical protein